MQPGEDSNPPGHSRARPLKGNWSGHGAREASSRGGTQSQGVNENPALLRPTNDPEEPLFSSGIPVAGKPSREGIAPHSMRSARTYEAGCVGRPAMRRTTVVWDCRHCRRPPIRNPE
jgi:hypothetical protein